MDKVAPVISIIIPVFNEEHTIELLYQQLCQLLPSLAQDYELIFVNDGSTDRSWEIINKLVALDTKIKALKFTRNFGQQMAFTAGYDIAQGDVIITMDCDLQDTPALIIPMLEQWQKGYPIVYARRSDRKDTFLKRWTAHWYYQFLALIADVNIPRNVGDFRLIDKKVLLVLRQCRERSRYLRGLVAWTGFDHTFVDFKRPDRCAGQTGYTWRKLFKLAFDGITSFSQFPLKLPLYAAVMFGLLGIIISVSSFGTLLNSLIIFCLFLPLHCIFLWILGEYVGRLYDQEKNRPLYVIAERINC